MKIKRMLLSDDEGNFYFMLHKEKHYLKDISSDGYDLTCFTNCGYFGGFKLLTFEHDINDHAILELINVGDR